MRIQFKMIFSYVFFCSLHVFTLRPLSFFAEIRDCFQTSKALSHKTCTQQKDIEFSTLGFVILFFLRYLKKYTRTSDFSLSCFLDSYSYVLLIDFHTFGLLKVFPSQKKKPAAGKGPTINLSSQLNDISGTSHHLTTTP